MIEFMHYTMKKFLSILLWFLFALSAEVSFAQFQIQKITISSQGILVSNAYTNFDTPGSWNTSDTILTNISISSDSSFSFDGANISYLQDHSGNFPNDDWKKEITITFDSAKKSMSLEASYILTHYPNSLSQEYSNVVGKRIKFGNVPFTMTKKGDSISLIFSGLDMKNINLTEDDYIENYTRFTGKRFDYSTILNIPTDASLSVHIVGSFPLAVAPVNKEDVGYVIINSSSQTLKFSSPFIKQNQSLLCFDILGRKHDLEFLGANNTSATYSVKSLRPAVYFVNDGRETVKFMIGE